MIKSVKMEASLLKDAQIFDFNAVISTESDKNLYQPKMKYSYSS